MRYENKNRLIVLLVMVSLLTFAACRPQRQPAIEYHQAEKDIQVRRHQQDSTLVDSQQFDSTDVSHVKKIVEEPKHEESIPDTISIKNLAYEVAYSELYEMISGRKVMDFKRAVFVTENAFYNNTLSYLAFDAKVQKVVFYCNAWMRANRKQDYHEQDSLNNLKNRAIYQVLKDTIFAMQNRLGLEPVKVVAHIPYMYDFEDYTGKQDWSKMFVNKLLDSKTGNCHSLPYLYKILAEELSAKAYLAIAPNHLYIKNWSQRVGWYNTELTSGQFPIDAWITASGYITLESIRSGIYMDTLSLRQSIGLCMYDLAKGYEAQRKGYDDGFIIKCCDAVLKCQPNHINAMILKAESLKNQIEIEMKSKGIKVPTDLAEDLRYRTRYLEMESLYLTALDMGYREMPEKMYLNWLGLVAEEQYQNKKGMSTFKPKSR